MLDALQFTQCGKICKAVVLTEAGKVGREMQNLLRQSNLLRIDGRVCQQWKVRVSA